MTNPKITEIKYFLKDIENALQAPGSSPVDLSASSDLLSDSDISLSDSSSLDDGLSDISDMSSIASICFSPVQTKKRESKNKHKKQSQSKIPVPVRNKPGIPAKAVGKSNKEKTHDHCCIKLAKPIESVIVPSQQPMNFLAPDLSEYSNAAICIFEGTGFPKSRYGERSTYVVVRLHPDLPSVSSPVCFNKTDHAIYNGGFDLEVVQLEFANIVPIMEVYDFISEEQRELIGVAFIQLHMSRKVDDVCVVLQDEWVDVFTVNTRTKCGQIRVSIIFHNGIDVSHMIKTPEYSAKKAEEKKKQVEQKVVEEKPVMKESMAVQAEVLPLQQQKKTEMDLMMDNIGDLSLNFGSPIKMWKPTTYDADKIDQNIPVKQRASSNNNEPKSKKKPIHFIDEIDLDESSDSSEEDMTISASSFFINPKRTSHHKKSQPTRKPLQPKNNENVEPTVDKQKESLRNRFVKYGDFNWGK